MKLAERIFRRIDYRLTSPYGLRTHPVTGQKTFHQGADYGTKLEKWNQYALEDGVVLSCGIDRNGANAIFAWVSYPRINLKLLHYHLDQLFVFRGQKVNMNTIIGTTGTTGRSTGIHLHLGSKRLSNDTYFDPESFDYKPLDKPITEMLNVNGIWDRPTQLALQKHYKTLQDGFISGQIKQFSNQHIRVMKYGSGGSQFVRALQKDLGVSVDGYIGSKTISALQRKLGLKVDGVISPISNTVREMQGRLNDGTFGVWK